MFKMASYIVLHGYKTKPEEAWAALGAVAPSAAVTMAAGQAPARCIKTWNPFAHGRADYVVCLWEAEKPDDVLAALDQFGMLDHLTADVMTVDEIDWAQLAQMAQEAAPAAA
jgi:hypothetical protein